MSSCKTSARPSWPRSGAHVNARCFGRHDTVNVGHPQKGGRASCRQVCSFHQAALLGAPEAARTHLVAEIRLTVLTGHPMIGHSAIGSTLTHHVARCTATVRYMVS